MSGLPEQGVKGKTAKSILISCGARLAPFDIAEIRDLMSYDEMELDTIGDRKTALFVIISDTDDTFNFIVAMMYTQLFNLLCDKADDVYGGRLPGKEYTISGKLMDQKTGKAALVDKKELTAQARFTPDKASGSIELAFTFKADELGGKNLVAFEELYYGKTLIASHTDIKDEAQTVTLEKPADSKKTGSGGGKTSGGKASVSSPKTGDETNIFLFLIPMLLAAAGISALAIYRIRKKGH